MPVRVEDDGEAIASGGNKLMIGEGQRAEARKTVPSAATFGSLGRPVNTGSSQPATRIDSNSRPTMAFTLGIDFGTNCARALVGRGRDGAELGSCVARYRSGRQGVLLDPGDAHLARQHPGDYPVALEECVRGALAAAGRTRGFSAARGVGVGVDTTGRSPIPVDRRNRPLALGRKWRRNLEAQCWLWKDHTSWREAARITEAATRMRPAYIAKCGNRYSSEWFWSKIWHCLEVAPGVFNAAYSWVELADWIPSLLAGVTDPGQEGRNPVSQLHPGVRRVEDARGHLQAVPYLRPEPLRGIPVPAFRDVRGPHPRRGLGDPGGLAPARVVLSPPDRKSV